MKKYSKKNTDGNSTLEILIAFGILVLSLSAIIVVIFGNQSVSVDSETNNEAIYKTKKILESARAQSRQDFDFLSSTSTTDVSGNITYIQNLTVTDLSPCQKQATTTTAWIIGGTKPQKIELGTYLANPLAALALGGDCSSMPPSSNWDNPTTAISKSLGGQGATDIDVKNNMIYLTSDPSATSKEDLYIYEFNPTAITLTERGKINVSGGLNAVDTINNYAFTLNSETTRHLMVFDVSDPASPLLISSSTLPYMTTGIGRSIYYYNNFLYIGTQYLACPSCPPQQNNEFHVYDVSNPSGPIWRGSFNVNHNINDIVVRGNYAYLATSDDSGELHIYNISDPSNITFVSSFNTPGNEDGQSLYILGNKLYLGRDRTPSSRRDFYIFNITNPSNITELGSKNLGLNPGTSVVGLIVRGSLAFVGLDNPTFGLKILNISNPLNIVDHSVCTTLNFSENTTALDMEGDYLFSANDSNDEIRVIRDQTSSCS